MNYVTLFFAGAFLCNAVPHLVAGLQGVPFPTPFAKPRGVGLSAPLNNFIWGVFNLAAAAYLFFRDPVTPGLNAGCLAASAGAILIGLYLSVHFGKVQRGRSAG